MMEENIQSISHFIFGVAYVEAGSALDIKPAGVWLFLVLNSLPSGTMA